MAIATKNLIDKIAYEIGDENIEQFPPRVYLDMLDKALKNIFKWLFYKKIYYTIKIEDITTVANQEQYNIAEGKTIAIYYQNREISKKSYEKILQTTNIGISGTPFFYYETIIGVGFSPIPNKVLVLKRHYVPFLSTINSFDSVILLPSIFERLILLESCIQTIKIVGDENWIKSKANLYPKWEKDKEQEYAYIYSYYGSMKEPQNFFVDD